MATLRDELEKRQGAMSAVDAAVADRTKAAEILAQAKESAAATLSGADDRIKEITASQAKLDADQTTFKAEAEAFAKSAAQRELAQASITARQESVAASLVTQQAALEKAQAKLASDTAILEARITAFQEKVAHLTA
jgi:hypothetical protein